MRRLGRGRRQRVVSRRGGGVVRLACVALALVSFAALRAPRARAQSCDPAPTLEVTPANGASRVATDAPVRVRYPARHAEALRGRFDDGDVLITLVDLGGVDEEEPDPPSAVAGELGLGADRVLFFEPLSSLEPGHEFQLKVFDPDLSGLGYRDFQFETGTRADSGPPEFPLDERDVTLVTRAAPPECGAPEGSLAIGLGFPPASDDSDQGAVEHLGFLTRAAGLSAPRLLARWRASGSSASLDFVLSEEEASEPVCVLIRAIDGLGQVAENEPEICFDPIQGSFFRPLCALGGPPGAADATRGVDSLGFLVVFALAALAVRRRGRGSPDRQWTPQSRRTRP